MKSLSSYLCRDYVRANKYDAHIHLFSHNKVLYDYTSIPSQYQKVVGFMDTEFKHLDEYTDRKVMGYYDNFIKNYYDSSNTILLATGTTADQMISIHHKYPDIIKGFGEIKCYDNYQDQQLPFGNLHWFNDVLEYDKEKGLPVYLHWYVYNEERAKELEDLLRRYPSIPFVLCHHGLSPKHDMMGSYLLVLDLLQKYNNLYTDISYTATDFFLKHTASFQPIHKSKALIGSDINPNIINYQKTGVDRFSEEYKKIQQLDQYINCNNTFNILFSK